MNDYEKDYHEGHKEHEGKETMNKTFDAVLHLRALGPLRGDFSDSTAPSGEASNSFQVFQKAKLRCGG